MQGELEKSSGAGRERAFSEPVLRASTGYHLADPSKPLRWKLLRTPSGISVCWKESGPSLRQTQPRSKCPPLQEGLRLDSDPHVLPWPSVSFREPTAQLCAAAWVLCVILPVLQMRKVELSEVDVPRSHSQRVTGFQICPNTEPVCFR